MTIRKVVFAAAAAALLSLSTFAGGVDAAEKIAVIVSAREAPFEEALAGFKTYLSKQGIDAEYEVTGLDGSAAKAGAALQKVKKSGARLVVTLGSLATDAAVKEIADIPIIACMVLRTDGLKKSPNVTGVGLEFPLEVQFSWLQVLLPNARTVGVIYSSEENQKRVEAAGRILQNLGLRLAAQEVRSPQDVPGALDNLAKRADVLWGLADTLALSPQIAKNILLFSFRNNIPFVGLSPAWVKAGALYSLVWDYGDMGAQAADMAVKVLKGAPPAIIPVASPRKVYYCLNLKTAQQLKITLSDQLVRGARHTFSGDKP